MDFSCKNHSHQTYFSWFILFVCCIAQQRNARDKHKAHTALAKERKSHWLYGGAKQKITLFPRVFLITKTSHTIYTSMCVHIYLLYIAFDGMEFNIRATTSSNVWYTKSVKSRFCARIFHIPRVYTYMACGSSRQTFFSGLMPTLIGVRRAALVIVWSRILSKCKKFYCLGSACAPKDGTN